MELKPPPGREENAPSESSLGAKIGLAASVGVFAAALAMYLFDFSVVDFLYRQFRSGELGPVGQAVVVEGEVFHRLAQASEFTPMALNESIFEGDMVMVGSREKLVIRFSDGSQLEVGPNSLVKISFDVDFTLGELFVRKLSAQVYSGTAKGEGVRLKRLEKPIPLPLDKVAPKPSVAAAPVPAGPPPSELPPPPIALIHPPQDAIVRKNVVLFTWAKVDGVEEYVVEVAKDRGFQDVVAKEAVTKNVYPYRDTRAGKYYWRVVTKDGQASGIFHFEIK